MDVFTNTKKSKKIIIVLVILILFNFACPKIVKAGDMVNNIYIALATVFFWVADLPQKLLDGIFLDNDIYKDGKVDISSSRVGIGEDQLGEADSITVSAEAIIKGKLLLTNPNIFKRIDNETTGKQTYFDYNNVSGGKISLREVVSGWYYALRNLAIVALLSILVYVSIRMILSTVSQDKAKYKVMFKDWLVALCLLFFMHYIMVGILNLSDTITNSIGSSGSGVAINEKKQEIEDLIVEANALTDDMGTSDSDDETVMANCKEAMKSTVIYLAAVLMNYLFIVKYLIRSVIIIFLVLLAPITCITYPIDKISDGKAQAYNMWFQEFLYNVIIQPFHLLIYVVLIGASAELASKNLIYAMVCFGVMLPAEKFVKQMFGFKDKLGSPLGAFAGGAIASQLMSSLKSGGKGGNSGGQNIDSRKNDDLPPNTDKVNLAGTERSEHNQPNRNDPSMDDPAQQVDNNTIKDDNNYPEGIEGDKPEGIEGDNPEGIEDNNPEEQSDNPGTSEHTDGEPSSEDEPGKWERFKDSKAVQAINSRTSRHFMRKYGTTKIKGKNGIAARMAKRGASKLYRASKNVGRKAIKGAATLTGAVALGAFGSMLGIGKEMAAVGAAIGGKAGGAITNKTDKITEGIEGYAGEIYNAYGDHGKEKNKREFKENENNIRLARQNYKDRHGVEAKGDALDEELEKMYEMKQHGIDKNQYNDVLSDYENYKKVGMPEDEAMNTAMTSALQAQIYSAKDYRDEKTMKQAYDALYKQYEPYINSGKMGKDEADKKIRQILKGGARMKGVENPPLPPVKQKITLPSSGNMYGKLKFRNDATGESQKSQVKAIQDVLIEVGFDDKKIEKVMSYSTGNNNEEIIESFATNVKYIISNDVKENAHIPTGEIQSGTMRSKVIKNESVMVENLEKLGIEKQMGVADEKVKANIRELEKKEGTTKYREIAAKSLNGELSRNDKNNLSEKNLEMISKYKSAVGKGKKK